MNIPINLERPDQATAIEALLDDVFGAERRRKRSYFYRRGAAPVRELCYTAEVDGELVGTIRYWPIQVGAGAGLLLGPVAVASDLRGTGLGRRLILESLVKAEFLGHRTVVLVGDAALYSRYGFSRASDLGVFMPHEAEERVQVRFLGPGQLRVCGERGIILRADPAVASQGFPAAA